MTIYIRILSKKFIDYLTGRGLVMTKFNKIEFNINFYKTFSFWIGIILTPETIKDLFINNDYSVANWGSLICILLLMINAFYKK